MSDAKRDSNYIPTLLAVSSTDGVTPVPLYADPTTHRLYVDLPPGTGTVTSVSVTTANGVSGSVATNTTTPAITLTLGAITPTSVASSDLSSLTNKFPIAITNEILPNMTLPNAIAGNIAQGDVDIYTCPSNKKAIIAGVAVSNGLNQSTSVYLELKNSSTYYRLSSTSALTLNTDQNFGTGYLLNAGESISINTTLSGINVFPQIFEFDSTAITKKAQLLTLSSGDNTVYQAPANKTAIISSSTQFLSGQEAAFYVNTSGSVAAINWYVSSTTSSSTGTKILTTASVGNLALATNSGYITIPPNYYLILNTNQTGGNAWVKIIEI